MGSDIRSVGRLAQGEALRSVESQHLETAELRSAPAPSPSTKSLSLNCAVSTREAPALAKTAIASI
jgi:hypothetical protein